MDWMKSTIITTEACWLMQDWLFNKIADEYALSSEWDDRWRTGGNVDEGDRRGSPLSRLG